LEKKPFVKRAFLIVQGRVSSIRAESVALVYIFLEFCEYCRVFVLNIIASFLLFVILASYLCILISLITMPTCDL